MSLRADVGVDLDGFELDISLTVEPGETIAVLGPNGSGKTTLLRTLAGLIALDRGSIVLDHGTEAVLDDVSRGIFVPPERRSVGMVFQEYLLFGHLSALDNVAFGLRAGGMSRAEARRLAGAWLGRLGLADQAGSRPHRLSGGQAQRVALARALATDPAMLLLDEPLAALDVATRRQVRRDLRGHLAGYDGVRILVTHDPLDAYALADRVAIVDAGRLVQVGTIADITAHPRSRYVADLIGTNLIAGDLTPDGLVTAGGITIAVVADFTGPAFAVIRPQSVTLARDASATSARNTVTGIVDEVDRMGDRVRVSIDGPVRLVAEITVRALDAMDLRPGDTVHAAVKAVDIETYPR
jgi:molybdate transport system ATP-binding protein